jgi:hypothetical protein
VAELRAAFGCARNHALMEIQRSELEEVVGKTVRKEASSFLILFGIEVGDHREPRELRADLIHLRRWRKSAEQMQSYTMKTVITAIVVGGLGVLWLGIKTMLGK